jgi:hypothetical protein
MRGSIFSSLSLTRCSQAPYPGPRPERECPWCLCLRVEYNPLSKTNLSGSEERTNTTMVFPTPKLREQEQAHYRLIGRTPIPSKRYAPALCRETLALRSLRLQRRGIVVAAEESKRPHFTCTSQPTYSSSPLPRASLSGIHRIPACTYLNIPAVAPVAPPGRSTSHGYCHG